MKQAIFIERDGVLNQTTFERSNQPASPLTLSQFHINREAAPLLGRLKAAGFVLIVTTNQPGLSRGTQSRQQLDRMHEMLRKALPIDDLLMCPHDEEDDCPCRKPKPGLFLEASYKYQIALDNSFVISDKWQDAEAARLTGSTSLLLKSPWVGKAHRDFLVDDLKTAVEKILQLKNCYHSVAA